MGHAQQKQTTVIKINHSKLKTSPASKFKAQHHKQKTEAVKFTPPVVVRDVQPAVKPKKG